MIEIKDWVVFAGSGAAEGQFFVMPYDIHNYTNAIASFDPNTNMGTDIDGVQFRLVGETDPGRTGRGVAGAWFGQGESKYHVDMAETNREEMIRHVPLPAA